MKSVVVKTNGEVEVKDLNGLEELQKAVGGYIEAINLPNYGTGYVNEEGKLNNLPLNIVATMAYSKSNGFSHDVLVGDVIFTGDVNEEGNTDDISDKFVDFVKLIAKLVLNLKIVWNKFVSLANKLMCVLL